MAAAARGRELGKILGADSMQALIFLIDAVVSFFCALFLLRFMMQAMRWFPLPWADR